MNKIKEFFGIQKPNLRFTGTEVALSFQHLFAMFGATVLVPLIVGMNPSVALLTAGIGTLIFHLVTKFKVPVFLGSSFAFIPGTLAAMADGVAAAQGAIILAGLVYLVFSVITYYVGIDRIKKLFPPVVVGPIVILIGLSLAWVAINNSMGGTGDGQITPWLSWLIAVFTLCVAGGLMIYGKKIFSLIPLLIAIGAGYLLSVIIHLIGVASSSEVLQIMNFSAVTDNLGEGNFALGIINLPVLTDGFVDTLPKFTGTAIIAIVPVTIVTFMEHTGDMTSNSAVIGKDLYKDPGLHRTLIGDGLASVAAGLLGGPANTTYSENTGVLAATKNYDPRILRLAAVFAIVLAFVGPFGNSLQTIPDPVMGGVSMILFGMIAAVGIRVMVEQGVDLKQNRNVVITALILTLGIGITVATFNPLYLSVGGIAITDDFALSPLFVAALVGILANLLLPVPKETQTIEVDTAPELEVIPIETTESE